MTGLSETRSTPAARFTAACLDGTASLLHLQLTAWDAARAWAHLGRRLTGTGASNDGTCGGAGTETAPRAAQKAPAPKLAVAPEAAASDGPAEVVSEARARVYQDDGDLYRFQLIARDGSAILTSRSYADRKGARTGLNALLRNAADESRYRRLQRDDGSHYFEVKAANGRNLWTSADYEDVDRMNADLLRLIETAWRTASR